MSKFEDENVIPKLGDDIPESWQKQAEAEIKNGYRVLTLDKFKGKDNVEIHIFFPNQKVDYEATEAYSRVYSKFIKDKDFVTRKIMKKILEEKGVWGKEEEDLVEELRESMRDIEYEVAKLRKNEDFNKKNIANLKTVWIAKRKQLQECLIELNTILMNTVEGMAEEAERKVKLSHCVKYANGDRVWPTIEDYDNENDRVSLLTIGKEATLFWFGLTNEIINDLPADLIFGREETNQESS